MEYSVGIYAMPSNVQTVNTLEEFLNLHAKDRWRVHKMFQSYRGTQLIVIYERVNTE